MVKREQDFRRNPNEEAKEYFDDRPDVGQTEVTIKWSFLQKLIKVLKDARINRIQRAKNRIKNKIRRKNNGNTKVSRDRKQ